MRRPNCSILLVILFLPAPADASAQLHARSPDSVALAGSGTALNDRHSPESNPAAIPTDRFLTISVLRLYSIPELNPGSLSFSLPAPLGYGAAAISSIQLRGYRATTVSVSWMHSVSDGRSRAGGRFSLGITRIGDGRTRRAASVDLGVLHAISAGLVVAVHLRSVTGSPDRADFAFDAALVLGVAWRAAASLTFLADAEQSADHPASPRVGVEWSPVSGLALQAGTAWQPDRITGGLRIERGRMNLQIAAGYHDPLGITSAAGLAIRW